MDLGQDLAAAAAQEVADGGAGDLGAIAPHRQVVVLEEGVPVERHRVLPVLLLAVGAPLGLLPSRRRRRRRRMLIRFRFRRRILLLLLFLLGLGGN